MRKLSVLLILLWILFLIIPAVHAETKKDVTVPLATLEKIQKQLNRLKSYEKATPEVTVVNIKMFQDAEGRVYVKDTVEVAVKFADMNFKGEAKVTSKASMYPKQNKEKFVTRFGLMTAVEQNDTKDKELRDKSVYGTYRVFKYKKTSLEGLVNHKRAGLGIGYEITPNTKAVGGVVYPYGSTMFSNAKLVLGVGFSF